MPRTASGYRPKWAYLHELDRRFHVGTPGWTARHPAWQVRKLSAFRRLHMLGTHRKVHNWAGRQGYGMSSSVPLRTMVKTAVKGTLK